MGSDSVLPQIQSLMAADQLPPIAACLSMLAVGNPTCLDALLLDNTLMPGGFDVRAFLCDERFGEAAGPFLPEAPVVDWRADPDWQAWQIDRLRDWWRVRRASQGRQR
jgi:hypothetical protein